MRLDEALKWVDLDVIEEAGIQVFYYQSDDRWPLVLRDDIQRLVVTGALR
jgi:hypothetical protein